MKTFLQKLFKNNLFCLVVLPAMFIIGLSTFIGSLAQLPNMLSVTGYIGYLASIFVTIAMFGMLVFDRFSTVLNDNATKGIALCMYAAMLNMVPEIVKSSIQPSTFSQLDSTFLFSMLMIPFTLFSVAAVGAGGSLIAADTIIKRSAKEGAVNAQKHRNKQKK
jgi:hypothetical protein